MSEAWKLLYALLFALTPPCPTEDSTNCHWDAQVQGNGNGYDFISLNVDGPKTLILKGEWHGVDQRGKVKRPYPRPTLIMD
jgi:hypothetical protein